MSNANKFDGASLAERDFNSVSPDFGSLNSNTLGADCESESSIFLNDRFRIIRQLVDSPSISCWLTECRKSGEQFIVRDFALPYLSPEILARCQTETKILARVSCPSYCAPELLEVRSDVLRLVYPWIEGQPITQIIQHGELSARLVMSLACDVISALMPIHRHGFIHRDIRPSHVIVRASGQAVLCGYGPAWGGQFLISENNCGIEIASYCSPELSGITKQRIGPMSDLYSVGMILYTALVGRPAFSGDTVSDILFQQSTKEIEWEQIPPETPPIVISFLQHLTRKEPRLRYQSARAALDDALIVRNALDGNGDASTIVIGGTDHRSELIDPAFVGRENDLQVIESALDESMSGGWQKILISGTSGMGKTRLIEETVRSAARKGFLVLSTETTGAGIDQPNGIWNRLLDQLSPVLNDSPILKRRLSGRMGDYREEVVTAMPQLAKEFGFSEQSLSGPDELGQGRIVSAIATLITSLGTPDRPVLIALDGCEKIDDMSLRILSKVAQSNARFHAVVLAVRTEAGEQQSFIEFMRPTDHVDVRPLDEDSVGRICESMAGPLPERAKRVVQEYAAGSPFMASAVLRGMVECEVLQNVNRNWTINPEKLSDFQAAENAGEILSTRIAGLPSDAKQFLKAAAVIGTEFSLDAVAELSGMSTANAFTQLALIQNQRLVWSKSDTSYAFVQEKIRQSVLDELTPRQIQEMHGRFGKHLLATQPHRCFDLAYHFDAARMHREALHYAVAAATEARATFSLESAQKQLEIAARSFDFADQATRHRVEMMLAEVLMLAGEYDNVEQWLDAAEQSAQSNVDRAKVSMRRGELFFKRGNKGRAVDYYESALRKLDQPVCDTRIKLFLNLTVELAKQAIHTIAASTRSREEKPPDPTLCIILQLYSRIAHAYWYTRDRYFTLWAHLRGMNQAERFLESAELAQAYSEHAPAMSLIGLNDRGLQYAESSLKIRRRHNDLWGQGQSRNFLSVLLYSASNFARCVREATKAVSILTRTGDFWEVHIARYQLAAALLRQGKLRESLEQARLNYRSALECGDHQGTGNIIDVWARASLGNLPTEVLTAELERDVYDPQRICQAKLAEGVNAFFQSKFDLAIRAFKESNALAEQVSVVNAYTTPCYVWLVTALREKLFAHPPKSKQESIRQTRELVAASKKALKMAKRFKNDLPHALRERAAVHGILGNERQSQKLFAQSLQVAAEQDAQWEQSLTILMRADFAAELNWAVDDDEVNRARQLVSRVKLSIGREDETSSLSLVDRFDALLESGRQIATSDSPDEICERVLVAASKILRGDRALIIENDFDVSGVQTTTPAGTRFDREITKKAKKSHSTVVTDHELIQSDAVLDVDDPSNQGAYGSFLCTPIEVRGEIEAYLYVANSHLMGLFGDDEIRIANYLASAAGLALEKADGFAQLQVLNQTLEVKVEDRTATLKKRTDELQKTANRLQATQEHLKDAKERAEAANLAKSEFLAMMSHEIRTPITAVLGYTDLILRGIDTDPEKQLSNLRRIRSNGTHLLQLLNDILDLSKIEADKVEVEQISCVPVRVVADAIDSLNSQANEKGIPLNLRFSSQLPERIKTDPTRLRQILTNLIGNAIKFTHEGEIAVVVSSQWDEEHSAPETLKIAIRDSGIGMSEEQMVKVFDAFSQADTSTTRQYGGTGLGLAISKRLAHSLGGDLVVRSTPGVGSEFTLTIATGCEFGVPTVTIEEAETIAAQNDTESWSNVDLAGIAVLIVDDAETNRDLISTLLLDAGAKVSTATNGQEALDFLEDNGDCIDVVLMDMQMPVLDGYTTTKKLLDDGFSKPIIAMTANTMVGDDSKCRRAGCADYLSKPIDLDALLLIVHRWSRLDGDTQSLSDPDEIEVESKEESSATQAVESGSKTPSQNAKTTHCLPDNWLRRFAIELVGKVHEKLPDLYALCNENDFDEIARNAHWMKGSGGTVGLEHLTNLATICEQSAKRTELKGTVEAIDEISQYIDELMTEV